MPTGNLRERRMFGHFPAREHVDLVRDVLSERLREVVGGEGVADVLDSIVDHVGLLG